MLWRNSKETVQTFLWMYYIEWRCVDEHILAPAYASLHPPSTSLPSKFQDLALRFPRLSRTTHFPGLSRYWKFYKHNSRTFQEAWESCTKDFVNYSLGLTRPGSDGSGPHMLTDQPWWESGGACCKRWFEAMSLQARLPAGSYCQVFSPNRVSTLQQAICSAAVSYLLTISFRRIISTSTRPNFVKFLGWQNFDNLRSFLSHLCTHSKHLEQHA